MKRTRNALFSAVLLVVSVVAALCGGEVILRVKNSAMNNYDIEIWRYSRELKVKSADPAIDFEHRRNASAVLQNVDVRLNEWGLRGGPVAPERGQIRRILFLGGSATLGWGVKEDETLEKRLERLLAARGERVEVLNGGIGNYNVERSVSRFLAQLAGLQPTDIVLQYFMRDAEALPPGGGNILLQHSELALTLWIAYTRLRERFSSIDVVEHYRKLYEPSVPGFVTMQRELTRLAHYARERNVRLYFLMTPDVHDLVDYKFRFIHDIMRKIAETNGFTYIDLLPAMTGLRPQQIWAMPGDPHPNAFAHQVMAETLMPVIARPAGPSPATAKSNGQ